MSEAGKANMGMEESIEKADLVMAEARLNIEMILESQKEERQQMEERHAREMESVRKHFGRVIFALVLTLVFLVGSALGGIIYILINYDFSVITYQDIDTRDSGTSIIEDGIHYNTN